MRIRKGQPYIVLIYLAGLIILGFAFAVLLTPVSEVYDHSYDHDEVQGDIYQQFFTRGKSLFLWLPLILALPLLIWVLVKAQEKQQGYN